MITDIVSGTINTALRVARLPFDIVGHLLTDENERVAETLRQEAAETKQRAREEERERKAAVAKAEVKREERIESQAKRERLDALDSKAEALDTRADAATAREEAQRLRRAAAKKKAQRKERAKQV